MLLACGEADPAAPHVSSGPVVRSVTLSAVPETLLAGDSLQLTARARDASGILVPGAPIGWRSLDASIATVGTSGMLQAAGDGGARIVASSGSLEDTIVVEVRAPLRFRDLAVGMSHACGLTLDGLAYCWGSQLGAGGTLTSSSAPVPVAGAHRFVSLSASVSHACGVDEDGAVWCWGYADTGALGDPTAAGTLTTPVRASSPTGFTAVDVGPWSTCALAVGGAAWCWGANGSPLGVGDTSGNVRAPKPVEGGREFARLSHAQSHTCALTAAGEAWCWGSNHEGQLASPGTVQGSIPAGPPQAAPVRVEGVPAFRAIDAGSRHTCAIAADSTAWCWGLDFYGEAGNRGCCVNLPAPVPNAPRFVQLSAGFTGTCAVTAMGETWCWGQNDHGQLGSPPSPAWPTSARRATSLPLLRLVRLAGMANGFARFSCGIQLDDTAVCWGTPLGGELGDGRVDSGFRVARVSYPRTSAGGSAR